MIVRHVKPLEVREVSLDCVHQVFGREIFCGMIAMFGLLRSGALNPRGRVKISREIVCVMGIFRFRSVLAAACDQVRDTSCPR